MKEKFALHILTILGLSILPFALKREPQKDWIITFLLKAFITVLLGNYVVSRKWIKYPVRLFPKTFRSSVLYDFLLFPLICVFYNQTTYKSQIPHVILQAFFYSTPLTIIEYWIERKTKLISYIKWTWYYTLFSVTGMFLLVRTIIGLIRKWNQY